MSDRIEAEILDVLGEEVAAAVDTPLVVIEGQKGDPGKDGITPTIGPNGNWYLGAEDTGKPSRGAIGAPGKDGNPGVPGKDGAPGIYYGTTPPTGDTHPVWIDPDGGPDDGGLLPAVTAADNGKVLRVVSSAWSAEDMPTGGTDMGITGATVGQIAKIAAVDASGVPTAWSPADMPSGGSSDFVVNATLDDNYNCTVDKTYAQIQEAVQDGKKPTVRIDLGGGTITMPLVASGDFFGFAGSIMVMPPMSTQYVVSIPRNNQVMFAMAYGLGLGQDETLRQVSMSKDPVQEMEIATKQYVDASGVPSVTDSDNGKFLRVVNGAWAAATINDANGVSF